MRLGAMSGLSGDCHISSASSESGFPEPGRLLLLRDLLEVRTPNWTHVSPWTIFQLDSFPWSVYSFNLEFKSICYQQVDYFCAQTGLH